jgi:hypothetical protein
MQALSVLLFVVGMMTGIHLAMITDLVRDLSVKDFWHVNINHLA